MLSPIKKAEDMLSLNSGNIKSKGSKKWSDFSKIFFISINKNREKETDLNQNFTSIKALVIKK